MIIVGFNSEKNTEFTYNFLETVFATEVELIYDPTSSLSSQMAELFQAISGYKAT